MRIRPNLTPTRTLFLTALLPLTLLTLFLWQGEREIRPIVAQEADAPPALPFTAEPAWSALRIDPVSDLAWGDVDNDGDLDLLVGTSPAEEGVASPNLLYRNENGRLGTTPVWFSAANRTRAVRWADLNRDGWLDLVFGNDGADEVYLNDGTGTMSAQADWESAENNFATDLAVQDVDGNGIFDLVATAWLTRTTYHYALQSGSVPYPQEGESVAIQRRPIARADVIPDNGMVEAILLENNVLQLIALDANGQMTPISDACDLSQINSFFQVGGAVWGASSDGRSYHLALFGRYLNAGPGGSSAPYLAIIESFSTAFDCASLSFSSEYAGGLARWTDVDGDGRMDLFLTGPNRVLLQAAPGISPTFQAVDIEIDHEINSTSWADVDGDGDLDLMTYTSGEPLRLYHNEQNPWRAAAEYRNADQLDNVLWGDMDNDGDFDRVRAPYFDSRGVYLDVNQNGVLSSTRPFAGLNPFISADTAPVIHTFAWGDFNDDRYIDIAISTYGAELQLYQNDGQGSFLPEPVWRSEIAVLTSDLAWGDVDADGYLDLAVGTNDTGNSFNLGRPDLLFRFDPLTGQLEATPSWQATDASRTGTVRWVDVDQDGDLDLVAADSNAPIERVYINNDGILTPSARSGRAGFIQPRAPFYLNGDANLFRPTANGVEQFNHYPAELSFLGAPPLRVTIVDVNTVTTPLTDVENVYSAPADPPALNRYYDTGVVTFFYEFSGAAQRAYDVAGFFSIDGGATWQQATPTDDTARQQLPPDRHTFSWDVTADGLTGRNDDVRFRLQVQPRSPQEPQPYSTAGVFQQPVAQAETLPFRVQGVQIRVMREGEPEPDALVYHRPAGSDAPAALLRDRLGAPLTTDRNGYLNGRPLIKPGDQLFALGTRFQDADGIDFTDQITRFDTGGLPTTNGLPFTTVSETGGVQTLSVSSENALLLFHPTVSLEWDARNDATFLAELEQSFKDASALLYDVTNGQMALGQINVFHDKAFWTGADIVVHADNGLRPSAAIGGVVNRPITETLPSGTVATYGPGQIRMGSVWDPYGERTADLGDDWSRALAHELGHYLLFLLDNYLGEKESDSGILGRVNCPGSFMTSTSDPSYSEFLLSFDPPEGVAAEEWQCDQTLAQKTTERADWGTITDRYPMLRSDTAPLDGPTVVPLGVTTINFWALADDSSDAAPTVLPARNFDVRDTSANQNALRLPTAQAYLFKMQGDDEPTNDVLLQLGSPTGGGNRLKVRGAEPGDRLCLFGVAAGARYATCDALTVGDAQLQVNRYTDGWRPSIRAQSVTSRTVAVTVTGANSETLNVQVFPLHYRSEPGIAPIVTLANGTSNLHTGQITLTKPAFEVAVRVWVPDEAGQREAITTLRLQWGPEDVAAAEAEAERMQAQSAESPLPALILTGVADPNNNPIGSAMLGAFGDPNNNPIGSTLGSGFGDPNNNAIGSTLSSLLGDPNNNPIGSALSSLGADPNNNPIGSTARDVGAPIRSADANVWIYSRSGFFEENGVASLQVLSAVPELSSAPWLVPVGQAYRVTLEEKTDPRIVSFTYLQRDVPEGYEHTLQVYFLADGAGAWERLINSVGFVENQIVAELQMQDGVYAVFATIGDPALALTPGAWNVVAYPLPDCREAADGLASIWAGVDGLQLATGTVAAPEAVKIADNLILKPGRSYWVHLSADAGQTIPYFAPPQRNPDGTYPGCSAEQLPIGG